MTRAIGTISSRYSCQSRFRSFAKDRLFSLGRVLCTAVSSLFFPMAIPLWFSSFWEEMMPFSHQLFCKVFMNCNLSCDFIVHSCHIGIFLKSDESFAFSPNLPASEMALKNRAPAGFPAGAFVCFFVSYGLLCVSQVLSSDRSHRLRFSRRPLPASHRLQSSWRVRHRWHRSRKALP